MTGCSAYGLISHAVLWDLKAAPVDNRCVSPQKKVLIQPACAYFVGGKVACECQWPRISSSGLLNLILEWKLLGMWKMDKAASGGLKISSFCSRVALKQSELVFVRALHLFLRGTDLYWRVGRQECCSFFPPCILYKPFFLVMVTCIAAWRLARTIDFMCTLYKLELENKLRFYFKTRTYTDLWSG